MSGRLLVTVLFLSAVVAAQDKAAEKARAVEFAKLLGDEQLGAIAERVLTRMGADAVPALAYTLADANSAAREKAADLLAKVGKDSDAAKTALARHVGDRDDSVRVAACRALVRLGDKSDPVIGGLSTALAATNADVRQAAAAALNDAGRDAQSAIPALVRALGDSSESVREQAARTLSGMGVVAVKPLGDGTQNDSPIVRAMAVRALARIGADAKDAVPQLAELLRDGSKQVRLDTADALRMLGAAAADAADELQAVLDNDARHAELREKAFLALDAIRPDGWDPVAKLKGFLRSQDPLMRAMAARQMGAREVNDALDDLLLGFNDVSHLVREASARAAVKIAPASADVLALLIAAVNDQMILSPRVAADVLGGMGSNAKDAVSALENLAKSEDEDTAKAAQEALKKIGS